jgi:dipeptidase E
VKYNPIVPNAVTGKDYAAACGFVKKESKEPKEKEDKKEVLLKKDDLKNFNGVYVAGGNSFLLLKSFIQSGFDQVLKELLLDPSFVYIGYSAGICVLAPDLYGLEIVDDPYVKVEKYSNEIIWKGLGILEYLPVPHYKSEDKEISDGNDKVIEKLTVNGVKYTPIRDGEVVIIDNP